MQNSHTRFFQNRYASDGITVYLSMKNDYRYLRLKEIHSIGIDVSTDEVKEFCRLFDDLIEDYKFDKIDYLRGQISSDINVFRNSKNMNNLLKQKFYSARFTAINSIEKYLQE